MTDPDTSSALATAAARLSRPAFRAAGWILVAASIAFFFCRSAYETYGLDFFYYWNLAGFSREVRGPEVYRAHGALLKREAASFADRLRSEWNPAASGEWVLEFIPNSPDPRRKGARLPRRYFPEWSTITEHATQPHAPISPLAYGTIRFLQLDRIPFRPAFFAWNILSLAALVLGIAWLRRVARLIILPLSWLLLAALWFDPCRSAMIYGQVMELAFVGAVGFLRFYYDEKPRPFVAGALLASSVLMKPLALGLPILLVWERLFGTSPARAGRALSGFFTALMVIALGFESILGWGVFLEWIDSLPKWYAAYTFHLSSFANRSAFAAILGGLNTGADSPVALLAFRMYQIGAVIPFFYFFLTRIGRSMLARDPLSAPAMAVLGTFLLSKFVLIHYGVFLMIPLAVLLARAFGNRETRATFLCFLVTWSCYGFYEHSDFLLETRLEVILTPLLLLILPSGSRAERNQAADNADGAIQIH